ncbi:LacI family DNA-binding transcriptional regulator [Desulforamulus ruminis]|uniref:Periplasmic binding protein/LacI transcriptional regulator n=1 Tax=Desulforamulus ruminis (strain ATCC 23193 / DSM 2154 / NCIMB 8452 / DL) TaxID=696281 RepID=F6DR07_DESRL|nr:LacI family DNA-binding transcriptional regulator [Desulforamulus ruminis]AEG59726.1 periplasmic binding protein/LacI transcriptional regulator [Desulforamulus ruminis DSM 2154]
MSKPTIEDVAKLAKVSTATVSRVINKQGGVRKATEERIAKAISQLDYIPNAVARSMVKKTTKTIGVIIPDINNPFFPLVVSGIEQQAREKGYFTVLCNTNESPEIERELTQILLERSVDGLIVTTADEDGKQLQSAIDRGIPIVAVDRAIKSFEVDTVLVGNIDGAYQATRHLILQGHKRIAIICGPQNTTPGYERFVGFKKALEEYQIPLPEDLVLEGDFKEESGFKLTQKLYSMQERPTAIFSSNNLMTVGCVKAVMETGWQMGKELAFIGFDDVDIATFVTPSLSVVSRPMRQLGELAFDILYEKMTSTGEWVRRHYVLSPELKIRQSCTIKNTN